MSGKTVRIEAASLAEARRIAASQLGVGEDALAVEVVRHGRASLFGRKETWVIEAKVRIGAGESVVEDALRIANAMAAAPVSVEPAASAASTAGQVVDGAVEVKVDPDLMSARIIVRPPAGGAAITVDDARKALADAGVTAGIDEEALRRVVELADPTLAVVVARGRPAVDGQNARIEYRFDVDPARQRPVELADGRVDYHNLNLIQNVKRGDVLAVKVPAESGVDGFNVRGERIPAKPGRDVQLPVGKGCEVLADGLTIVAAVDGQVVLTGGRKIAVLPVYEVRGDVDLSTGNINFVGSVVVRGSLASGFEIRAEGDVTVDGYVDAGTIVAGGNVVIRKGIQGRNKGVIEAGGSVNAMFVENGTIHAGADAIIAEAIMHSEVVAGGSVVCMGRRGLIVGGRIQARNEVSAKVIGAAMGTLTEIEVGVDPALREELIKTAAEQRELEENLNKTTQAVKMLKDIEQAQGGLDPDRKDKLLKLIRSQYQLMGQRDALAAKRRQIEEQMENSLRGRVRASDLIHPGTRVTIGRSTMHLTDEIRHSSLILGQDHTITVGPYD